MPTDYTPISCDFYDVLTLLAIQRRPVAIGYRTPDGAEADAEDAIADVYTQGDEEYVRLAGGREIRLDRLVTVDGQPLPRAC